MTKKQSLEYFFHQRCKKTAINTDFDWLFTSHDYLILIGLFQQAKEYFSLRISPKVKHNARQSDNNCHFPGLKKILLS